MAQHRPASLGASSSADSRAHRGSRARARKLLDVGPMLATGRCPTAHTALLVSASRSQTGAYAPRGAARTLSPRRQAYPRLAAALTRSRMHSSHLPQGDSKGCTARPSGADVIHSGSRREPYGCSDCCWLHFFGCKIVKIPLNLLKSKSFCRSFRGGQNELRIADVAF
jgi:hypothetical protein